MTRVEEIELDDEIGTENDQDQVVLPDPDHREWQRGRHPASSEARLRAKELGQKIKKARNRRGVSQRQLSIDAEVPQSTISRLERGVAAGVTIDTILRISRSLNQPTDVLLGSQTASEVMRSVDPVPSHGTWLFAMQCRSSSSARDLVRLLLHDIRKAERRVVGFGVEVRRSETDIDSGYYASLRGSELASASVTHADMLAAMHFQKSGDCILSDDFLGSLRAINVLPTPVAASSLVGLHATVYVTFATEVIPQDITIRRVMEDLLEVAEVLANSLTDPVVHGGYPPDAVNSILGGIVDLTGGMTAITDANGRILYASEDLAKMSSGQIDNAFDRDEVGDISSIGRRAIHLRSSFRKPNVSMQDGRTVNVSVTGITSAVADKSYAVWAISEEDKDSAKSIRQAQEALSAINYVVGVALDGISGQTLSKAVAEQVAKTLKADRVIVGRLDKEGNVDLPTCVSYKREGWAVMRERVTEDMMGQLKVVNDIALNGTEIFSGDIYGIPLRYKSETVGFAIIVNPEDGSRVLDLMNPIAVAFALQR